MRIVRTNKAQLEYDIHSLVKAFYPEQEVKVLTPESVVKDKSILELPADIRIEFTNNGAVVEFAQESPKEKQSAAMEERNMAEDAEKSRAYIWESTQTDPAEYKNEWKKFLYLSLQERTGISLPWGDLIGIRPTKIAMTMLEQGRTEEEIDAFLRDKHLVSSEKRRLGLDIAKREKKLLDRLHYEGGYSLYIGIPFCPTTCLYCSFTSFPIHVWKERVGDYLTALEKELESVAQMCEGKVLDTVYIGGGTPSSLSAQELDRLLTRLRSLFDFRTVQEFTVEAGRADSITMEKLQVLYRHEVSRISVNPQTMKQKTLDFIGRRHTVEQVIEAFHMARKAGFENINMDIILGLPGETPKDVEDTIAAIKELDPDSLTVHSLAVKRASRLSQWIEQNGITMLNNTEETMRIAAQGAADMEMLPYYLYRQKNMSGNFENVGYSKKGKYGLYNILIMEEKQTILACGAGTITKRVFPDGRIERCDNVKDVGLYIEKIDEMIERKRTLFSE